MCWLFFFQISTNPQGFSIWFQLPHSVFFFLRISIKDFKFLMKWTLDGCGVVVHNLFKTDYGQSHPSLIFIHTNQWYWVGQVCTTLSWAKLLRIFNPVGEGVVGKSLYMRCVSEGDGLKSYQQIWCYIQMNFKQKSVIYCHFFSHCSKKKVVLIK